MAYTAGGKIICELIRSKFYPRGPTRNIGINSIRLSHVLAIHDKAKRFNKERTDHLLYHFWRGLKTGIMGNLVVLKLISPTSYACGYFSKYSTGALVPVGDEPQEQGQDDANGNEESTEVTLDNRRSRRLYELLSSGDLDTQTARIIKLRRNLNDIAFKQNQSHYSDIRPKNQKRLTAPSRMTWAVSTPQHPSRTKYQFVEQKSVDSDLDFADNLSILDGETKQKLNTFTQKGITESASITPKMNSIYSNKIIESRKSKLGAEMTAHRFGHHSEYKRVEKTKRSANNNDAMHVFRSKGGVSSGVVSGSKQNKLSLKSLMTTKSENVGVSHSSVVRPRTTNSSEKVGAKHRVHFGAGATSRGHVNPENISSSNSMNTINQFQEINPKYRLKRDLISVVLNTGRIPLIDQIIPSYIGKTSSVNKVKLTSLHKSVPTLTKMQKYSTSPDPQGKTRNSAPRKARTPSSSTLNKSYGYKLRLNPAGTDLRQTIVVQTPKLNLANYRNTLLPAEFPLSKTRGISASVAK